MKHLKKRRSKRNEEFSGAEGNSNGQNQTNEKLIEKNNSQRIFNINTY